MKYIHLHRVTLGCALGLVVSVTVVVQLFWLRLSVQSRIPSVPSAFLEKPEILSTKEDNSNQTSKIPDITKTNGIISQPTLIKTQRRIGPRAKSIVFLKSFKVGGTTLSSILIAYLFNTNQHLDKTGLVCKGRNDPLPKGSPCVDVVGVNHPPSLPCHLPENLQQSNRFCNPVEIFMFIRNPVERLWSGYAHEVKIDGGDPFPLSRFLDSKSIVKTPPHHLLDKDWSQAIAKTSSTHILLTEKFDESLVYMAQIAGLKLCDIMYVPCNSSASWSSTKCNPITMNLAMTNKDKLDLQNEVNRTGEQKFYDVLYKNALEKIDTKEIRDLTKNYQSLRERALKKCQQPSVIKAIEAMLSQHPNIRRGQSREHLWHLKAELTNPLDPVLICLGWHCT